VISQAHSDERRRTGAQPTPWLERVASGVGFLLTCAVFGFIGWQALFASAGPPVVSAHVERVIPLDHGYLVQFRAYNESGSAAAQVEIEGRLVGEDGVVTMSRAQFDYIPGRSSREGGLFFDRDPRGPG
jgi:uncharacterized protein (TIGR02588 family)